MTGFKRLIHIHIPLGRFSLVLKELFGSEANHGSSPDFELIEGAFNSMVVGVVAYLTCIRLRRSPGGIKTKEIDVRVNRPVGMIVVMRPHQETVIY